MAMMDENPEIRLKSIDEVRKSSYLEKGNVISFEEAQEQMKSLFDDWYNISMT